jgi:hypothetical protein
MRYFIIIQFTILSLFADYNATANADNLGMYYQNYNANMAQVGILAGAIIMFGMVFLTIKIGSR